METKRNKTHRGHFCVQFKKNKEQIQLHCDECLLQALPWVANPVSMDILYTWANRVNSITVSLILYTSLLLIWLGFALVYYIYTLYGIKTKYPLDGYINASQSNHVHCS